jgi:ferritin-like metal-binding protein YciE
MAKQLGESQHAQLLQQTLKEEKETDAKLTSISEKVTPTAAEASAGKAARAKKTA